MVVKSMKNLKIKRKLRKRYDLRRSDRFRRGKGDLYIYNRSF